jgi:hypothetical protein
VPKAALERGVIAAVRGHYAALAGVEGRAALGAEIDRLLLGEGAGRDDAKARLTKRIERIDRAVRNLLDNLSPATKDMGERRLLELERERTECAREMAALESLTATRREARAMADEASGYVTSLVALLDAAAGDAAPDPERAAEVATALRRCVQTITVDAAGNAAALELRTLPVLAAGPAFQATARIEIPIDR